MLFVIIICVVCPPAYHDDAEVPPATSRRQVEFRRHDRRDDLPTRDPRGGSGRGEWGEGEETHLLYGQGLLRTHEGTRCKGAQFKDRHLTSGTGKLTKKVLLVDGDIFDRLILPGHACVHCQSAILLPSANQSFCYCLASPQNLVDFIAIGSDRLVDNLRPLLYLASRSQIVH